MAVTDSPPFCPQNCRGAQPHPRLVLTTQDLTGGITLKPSMRFACGHWARNRLPKQETTQPRVAVGIQGVRPLLLGEAANQPFHLRGMSCQ